jgi:2-polyprenyl-3-methyl-5-hydroxy-6-metoxy-1,4-benzoquinol methylase
MSLFLKKISKKIGLFVKPNNNANLETYDFNKSNPLGGDGERVDIQLQKPFNFDTLDMYQKNHFRRYEFAKEIIDYGDICGDFACGTGYGSVLVSDKASKVIGADLDEEVITAIKERYKDKTNVSFLNENLLNLKFENIFDTIISFETIEHFLEEDIKSLLKIFAKSLKENGKFIFSTPYMQEKSEAAMKLGFHFTFYIDEKKIENWLNEAGLIIENIHYQNYDTHFIKKELEKKDFIICVARRITNG